MNLAGRRGLLACLCVGATGCAILPAVGINLAAHSAQGLVALTLGPLVTMQERSEEDRCLAHANKGISVTESLESTIPGNEGEVTIFESASWRPEFAREGYPQIERSRAPTDGTLAISERAALLLPPPGATSVRIPYELVQKVSVHGSDATGEPRFMIVNSCFGRFDIVTFLQRQPNDRDPEATAVAAARLESRVAAFRAATDR
jgi:hypothetical protein